MRSSPVTALLLLLLLAGCGNGDPAQDKSEVPKEKGVWHEPEQAPPELTPELIHPHVEDDQQLEIPEGEKQLPDLFGEQEKSKNMQVQGKLLQREDAETLKESVEGVEVNIKVNRD